MQYDIEKMIPPPLADRMCTECGARVPDEFPTCDGFCASVLAGSRRDSVAGPARLVVDAFALQHPKRACKSAKSYAGHLASLCCGVNYAGSAKVHRAIQLWMSTSADRIGLVRPREPEFRGKLTVQHLGDAQSPSDFDSRVREWANGVWGAYASQHEIAEEWVARALAREPHR